MKNLFFKKIELKSFKDRNIDSIIIDNLKNINLIIAPNGRGKSTFCEAIRTLIAYKKTAKKIVKGNNKGWFKDLGKISGKAIIKDKEKKEFEFNTEYDDPWSNQLDIEIDKKDKSYVLSMKDFIDKGKDAFLETIRKQTRKGLNIDKITNPSTNKQDYVLTESEKRSLQTFEINVEKNNKLSIEIPEKKEFIINAERKIEDNVSNIKNNGETILNNITLIFQNLKEKFNKEILENYYLEDKLVKSNKQNNIDTSLYNIKEYEGKIEEKNKTIPEKNIIDFNYLRNYEDLFKELEKIKDDNYKNEFNIINNNTDIDGNHYNKNLKIDKTFDIKKISGLYNSIQELKDKRDKLIELDSTTYKEIVDFIKDNPNPKLYIERQKATIIENQKNQCELNALNELVEPLNEAFNLTKTSKMKGIISGVIGVFIGIVAFILGKYIFSIESIKIGGLCVGVFGLAIAFWTLIYKDDYRKNLENFKDDIDKQIKDLEGKNLNVDLNNLKYNYEIYFNYKENQKEIKETEKSISENEKEKKEYLIKYGFDESVSLDYIKDQYDDYVKLYKSEGLLSKKEEYEGLRKEYREQWNKILKDFPEIQYNNEEYSTFISDLEGDHKRFISYKTWQKELNDLKDKVKKENEKVKEYFEELSINNEEEYNIILNRLEEYSNIMEKIKECNNKIASIKLLNITEENLVKFFEGWNDLSEKDEKIKSDIDELLKENKKLTEENSNLNTDKTEAETFVKSNINLSNNKDLLEIARLKALKNDKFSNYLNDYVKYALNNELSNRSNKYAKKINSKTEDLFKNFTNNRYSVTIEDEIEIKDELNDEKLSFETLSRGTQIQLILATRIAMIEQLEEKLGIKLPIFLDEVTENSDFERTKEIINTLANLKDRQIFCFSPKKFAKEEWINALGADKVNVIELS